MECTWVGFTGNNISGKKSPRLFSYRFEEDSRKCLNTKYANSSTTETCNRKLRFQSKYPT